MRSTSVQNCCTYRVLPQLEAPFEAAFLRSEKLPPSQAMRLLGIIGRSKQDSRIQIQELAPGIWKFDSGKAGPVVSILGGVHGNEDCGVDAVLELFEHLATGKLELLKGSVILTVANEIAFLEDQRQLTHNMNRQFGVYGGALDSSSQPYEVTRAREVAEHAINGTSLTIDLHSTSLAAPPFCIQQLCLPGALDSQISGVVGSRRVVLFSSQSLNKHLPGTTLQYAHTRNENISAVTIECGQHKAPETQLFAKQAVWLSLKHLGLIDASKYQLQAATTEQELYQVFYVEVKKEGDSFEFKKEFKSFAQITASEVIGTRGSETVLATENCVILFPTIPEREVPGAELFFLARRV